MSTSISRATAARSLTEVKWFVWDDIEAEKPVVRPATEEEIDLQQAEDGVLVSDWYTLIVHEGRVIVDNEKLHEIPTGKGGVAIFQRGGVLGTDTMHVYMKDEQEITAIISALTQARDYLFKK